MQPFSVPETSPPPEASPPLLRNLLASRGLNDQVCYEAFLASRAFRDQVVGLRTSSFCAAAPQSEAASSSVCVWDPSENLWREGNGADWRIALLYYDEVRSLLEEAVRAEAAAERTGTAAAAAAAAASPSLSPSALRRFLDRFSRFDASKLQAARYLLAKLPPEQYLLGVVLNAHRRDLLPANAGVCVDLRAARVVAREKDHFFSRAVWLPPGTLPSQPTPMPSPFGSSCSFVEATLRQIFGGDEELVDWIQKLFGLYLTGEKYSKMVCLFGGGSNGKSVLARWLGRALGSFAQMDCPKPLLFDTVASASSGGARDFGLRQDMLARAVNDLEGRRLAICDEVGSDLCLSDDKFKQITGGGSTMTARRLHQDARAVDTSQCKILTLANPPFFEVSSAEAFRRRLLVVEMPCRFSHKADEVDHVVVHLALEPSVLEAKLDVHLGEFFRWCVLGAARYYAEGIDNEPRAAIASTSKFFSEQDVVVQFFDQAPLEHTGSERDGVPLQVLAMLWQSQGIGHITTRSLGKLLRSRSDKFHYGGEYVYSGGKKSRGLVGWRRVTEE